MQDNFDFQHYLVVFFDLLGQRENLRKITELPTDQTEQQRFIDNDKGTIGRVLQMQEDFKKFYEGVNSYTPNENDVPSEHRDAFREAFKRPPLYLKRLSDAMVIGVPLISDNENCVAISGIYYAFVATCSTGLSLLSKHVPIRAGLDVGVATQIDDNEIYGPALERAIYLESKLAEYPRFLVGEGLINYLSWAETQKFDTKLGGITRKMAKLIKSIIIQDTDGRYMLDFLSTQVREWVENTIELKLVASAYGFVLEEYRKYSQEGNDKLASRYYRLLQYFHSRRNIWGINA